MDKDEFSDESLFGEDKFDDLIEKKNSFLNRTNSKMAINDGNGKDRNSN